ncbi:MAG: hypothetical protein ONB31_05915 [candidate division KSB1 bacterium]|nr:hypothetical protein [candidate division KSB1 bacterium]MDZ7336095.1 hypothetical protein [candidate division KSB1 bacterium]
MNRKSVLMLAMALSILMLIVSSLSAQHRGRPRWGKRPAMVHSAPAIGFRIGRDFANDQYLAGAHFWLPLGMFWEFIPSADYYFTGNETNRWQFDGDLVFKPRPVGPFYFGGGLAVQYLSLNNQTDLGGNVVVGLEFGGRRKPPVYPYVQARWTFLKDQDYFSLLGGINFSLR